MQASVLQSHLTQALQDALQPNLPPGEAGDGAPSELHSTAGTAKLQRRRLSSGLGRVARPTLK